MLKRGKGDLVDPRMVSLSPSVLKVSIASFFLTLVPLPPNSAGTLRLQDTQVGLDFPRGIALIYTQNDGVLAS